MTEERRRREKVRGSTSDRKRTRRRIRLKEADFPLVAVTIALVLFGLLMVYSASSYGNVAQNVNAYRDVARQGLFALVGVLIMVLIVSNVDYHRYSKRMALFFVLAALALNLAVLLFEPIKGARRWVDLGFISFQPSEIAKFVFVVYAANQLKRVGFRGRRPWTPVLKVMAVAGVFIGIIILVQRNLSIGGIIGLTALSMIFLSGASFLQWFFPILIAIPALVLGMLVEPYRMTRFLSFMKPFEDPQGSGHQLVQSLYALSTGGIFGRGLSMSRMKGFWLPEAHNDFIFAVVVEELGLLGGLLLMGLMLTLIIRGYLIATRARDSLGKNMALGIVLVFTFQSLVNIAVVVGFFPVTGVTLPFISAGGTSLVVNLAAVGILMNISRQSKGTAARGAV